MRDLSMFQCFHQWAKGTEERVNHGSEKPRKDSKRQLVGRSRDKSYGVTWQRRRGVGSSDMLMLVKGS